MDELMLDGNAVAGLLQEVFAVEMTTAVDRRWRRCANMYIGSNARRHLSTPYDEGGLPRGEATFGMEH
jgi:hypothetical protein